MIKLSFGSMAGLREAGWQGWVEPYLWICESVWWQRLTAGQPDILIRRWAWFEGQHEHGAPPWQGAKAAWSPSWCAMAPSTATRSPPM
jgi:hypothetical protein